LDTDKDGVDDRCELHVASDCDANFEGVPDSIYTESDNDGVRDGLKNGNGN